MKLSIIIPAYNAAADIEFCLTSCCAQDLDTSEYEIVVVNDGSTDATQNIVMAFARQHSQVRLVTQENKGNGAARNTGVTNATGDYIYFLDADDYIAENVLGTLLRLAEVNNLEFIGFSSKNVTDSSEISAQKAGNQVQMDPVCNGIEFLGSYNYKAEVWWYFVRRTFYQDSGVRFFDKKFVQDSYLTPTLLSKTNRAAFIHMDVHRYRQSQNSITRKKSITHLNQHFEDLSFSVRKLYELRKHLIQLGVTNEAALQRLHVKQQRYVFIVIIRFMKSPLEISRLKGMLAGFNALEAYPMHVFMSNADYRSAVYRVLTFIFNRRSLLFPAIICYRSLIKLIRTS